MWCVDKDKAMSWPDKQGVGRWHRLHRGTSLSQKFMRNELLSKSEWIGIKETIAEYRKRLYNISWLMANLSELIARQANKEDGCTGRFYSLPSLALTVRASCSYFFHENLWKGRFKSNES